MVENAFWNDSIVTETMIVATGAMRKVVRPKRPVVRLLNLNVAMALAFRDNGVVIKNKIVTAVKMRKIVKTLAILGELVLQTNLPVKMDVA